MDLVERVDRICGLPLSDRTLRDRLLVEIGRQVRFDGHVFAMTDPVSKVISSPHATLPSVDAARLPDLIRHRYALRPDQWAPWVKEEFGLADVVTVGLRDRYGEWGFLELWRVQDVFGPREHQLLDTLAPALTRALRTAVARSFTAARSPVEGLPVEGLPASALTSGVVLLDPDLRVRDESDAAARALLRLLPPDEEVPPVPAIAFNVGAALLAGELDAHGGDPGTRAWTRVHLGAGHWMTARAERLTDGLVVSLSPCTALERVDVFARSHAMSPREVEVLDLVLRGLDARQIAAHLTIARTTAEDHLRALLAKTGSASRQHLVLRALGAAPVGPVLESGTLGQEQGAVAELVPEIVAGDGGVVRRLGELGTSHPLDEEQM